MSMFDVFRGEHTGTYTYLGQSVEITITPLSLLDSVKMVEGKQDDKFKVILESMKKHHPDETLASVKGMPMAIANQLMYDIFVFNEIEVPDELKPKSMKE